jgi:hypothetical protein
MAVNVWFEHLLSEVIYVEIVISVTCGTVGHLEDDPLKTSCICM